MTYAKTITADAPVGWWRLGEASGTTAADSSANPVSGTYTGTFALAAAGALVNDTNTALGLTGAGRVVVANSTKWHTNSNLWSMEAWVYPTAFTEFGTIIRYSTGDGAGYFLRVSTAGAVESLLNFSGGAAVQASGTLTLNTWHHLVVTYDGTTRRHYQDGALTGSWVESKTLAFSTTADLGLGGTPFNEDFTGRLDEPALYNKALSAAQVAQHYKVGKATAYKSEVAKDAPVAWWRLGEATATNAFDETANPVAGTFTGTFTVAQPGALSEGFDSDFALAVSAGRVQVPNVAKLRDATGNRWGLEIWAYQTARTASATLFRYDQGSGAGYFVRINNAGNIESHFNFAEGAIGRTSTTVVPLNAWTHIVFTYDGTTRRLYVNGALAESWLDSRTLSFVTTADLGIGGTQFNENYTGRIDEPAIYNTLLSDARVLAHYQAAVPPSGLSLSAPTATATSSAPAPSISLHISLAAPVATATSSAPAPAFALGWIADPPAATLNTSASAPTISLPDRAYTDYSTYPSNAAPGDWTGHTGAAGPTAKVQGVVGTTGGKVFEFLQGSGFGAAAVVHYRAWDFVGSRENYTAVAKLTGYGVGLSASPGEGSGVMARIQADHSHYMASVRSVNVNTGATTFDLVKRSGGTSAVLVSVNKTGTATDPYVKIEASGSVIRAKFWWGTEPAAWDIEFTDTSALPAGRTGVGTYRSSNANLTTRFDTYEFGPPTITLNAAPLTLNWQVLPAVSALAGLKWDAYQAVIKSLDARWQVGTSETITVRSDMRWNTIGEVDVVRSLAWTTVGDVSVSRTISWATPGEVPLRLLDMRWHALQAVTPAPRTIPWNLQAPVQVSREIGWRQLDPIVVSTSLRWAAQASGVVVKSLSLPWETLAVLDDRVDLRWSSNLDGRLNPEFIRDFVEYAAGPLPADWSSVKVDTGTTDTTDPRKNWTIAEHPNAIGKRVLRGQNKTFGGSWLWWNEEPSLRDQDIALRVQSASSLAFRIGDPGESNYKFSVAKNGGVTIEHRDLGQALLGSGTGSSPAYTSTQWIWVRVQNLMALDGPNYVRQVKAKVWPDGTAEPANWNVSYTDSSSSEAQAGKYYFTVDGHFMFTGDLDLDWIGYVSPFARVVVPAPAQATLSAFDLTLGQSKTLTVGNTGGTTARALVPRTEVGDQVLVSWVQVEVPEPVHVTTGIVTPLIKPSLAMLAPSLMVVKNHTIEIPVIDVDVTLRAVPPFQVRAEVSQGVLVGGAASVNVAAVAPEVRIILDSSLMVEGAGQVSVTRLDTTVVAERNARVEVGVDSDATATSLVPKSVNGSHEVYVENVAGASLVHRVPQIIATLSIYVPLVEVTAEAFAPTVRISTFIQVDGVLSGNLQAYEPSLSLSAALSAPTARVSASALVPNVRLDWGVLAIPARVDLSGVAPELLVFFTKVHVSMPVPAPATASMEALPPEYRYTPAEVGEGVTVYLGTMRGQVRLTSRKTDVLLGSQRADVLLAEVRDEVRA